MADAESPNMLKSIREMKAAEPFVPFSIGVSSGDRYRIEDGDNLVEMKSEFFYAYPGGEDFVFIRINQITAVERGGSAGHGRAPRRKVS